MRVARKAYESMTPRKVTGTKGESPKEGKPVEGRETLQRLNNSARKTVALGDESPEACHGKAVAASLKGRRQTESSDILGSSSSTQADAAKATVGKSQEGTASEKKLGSGSRKGPRGETPRAEPA